MTYEKPSVSTLNDIGTLASCGNQGTCAGK